jgi:hypothetical protein
MKTRAAIARPYRQDRIKPADQIAYVHYFCAVGDWWVLELDPTPDPVNGDYQAFCYVRLAVDPDGAGYGWQSLAELEALCVTRPLVNTRTGEQIGAVKVIIERDLSWKPTAMREVLREGTSDG